ncbi:MAG: ABC transporter substrate-binding protein [Oscillospiraceae bacterium]|nr:ABC transporter substrate-binding protein [Oscillospiraceae bacterium]
MKKHIMFLLVFAMILPFALAGCGGSSNVVNVYNWGEYIDESIFDEFEEETGIHVNYSTFETNEALYSTLKSGGSSYDVIIPSDYMISRMIQEDMLEPLDFSNIPNAAKIDLSQFNIKPEVLSYDPDGTYSVPYSWGSVGIIYNTTKVTGPVDSWSVLFDEANKGQVLMFNNSRDAIGLALKYLGYSLNTTDESQIKEATDLLIQQKEAGIVQAYVMDQIFEKMISGESAIGPYYAGDAITMISENPDLAFCSPKEGTNLFLDAMCIPKGAENKDNAEAFINFMCKPEIMVRNADVTGYCVPSIEAYNLLDDDLKNSTIAYPPADRIANMEIFTNLPEDTLALYDSEWSRLTAAKAG